MLDRPTVAANVITHFSDNAPARVKKRLDKAPDAASQWQWSKTGQEVTVVAAEETVTLQTDDSNCLLEQSQVRCTCLLSPKCFHVLAVVTSLKVAAADDSGFSDARDSAASDPTIGVDRATQPLSTVQVSGGHRKAANNALNVLEEVLQVGARATGIVLQSDILRAAHDCRCEELVNLSNGLIRVAEGIYQLRTLDDHANSGDLLSDFCYVVEVARAIRAADVVAAELIGYVRRPFHPIGLARLDAIVCEPILTRSGYAGVCIYLAGDDGEIYTVVQSRPGSRSIAHDAYQGGVDLGGLALAGRELSRASLDVQNLTASPDGRLGKGKATRWAVRRQSAEVAAMGRFRDSFASQLNRILEASISHRGPAAQRTGWDLVRVQGAIAGSDGTALLLDVANQESQSDMSIRLRLEMPSDSKHLFAFENFELLSSRVGLSVEVIGRVQLDCAGNITALSIAPTSALDGGFDLRLPEKLHGRYQVAFDKIQPHEIRARTPSTEEESETAQLSEARNLPSSAAHKVAATIPTSSLEGRMINLLLGGRRSINSVAARTMLKEQRTLVGRSQPTAATLHRKLHSACETGVGVLSVFAACDLYTQAAARSQNFAAWSIKALPEAG